MKFLRAEIYGFGKWIDQTFDFSNQSFICFYGENEAGKSTLQQFFLFMLFGFTPKKLSEYEPKFSNRIGGTLTIMDETVGVYTIERTSNEVSCLLPNGNKVGRDWLQKQLGLTKEVYKAIYSFSAPDLIEIRNMKADQLSDVLFSVGLTGAKSIYEVERKLENQLGELFKKAGRKPVINKQIESVHLLYNQLLHDKDKESTYREKITLKKQLEQDISEIDRKLFNINEELHQNEKIVQIVPLLYDYHQFKQKLIMLPEEIPFPENGIKRYELLKDKLLPIESELRILKNDEQQFKNQMMVETKKLYTKEAYEVAKNILKQKHVEQSRQIGLDKISKKLDHVENLLKEELRKVGVKETDLDDIDLPFYLEKTWKEISTDDALIQHDHERLTEDYRVIELEKNELTNERKDLMNQLIPEDTLNEIQKKVKQYYESQFHQQSLTEQTKKWNEWDKKRFSHSKVIIYTTSISAIITLFLVFYLQQYSLLSVPLILIVISIIQYIFTKKWKHHFQQQSLLKIEPTLIMSEKERVHHERIIKEQEQIRSQLQIIENEMKRLDIQLIKWEERNRLLQQKKAKWTDRVQSEQYKYPFLEQFEPKYWIELLHIVQHIKELIHEKVSLKDQQRKLREQSMDFQKSIKQFANIVKWEHRLLPLEQIEEMIDSFEKSTQLIEQYKQLLAKNRIKQTELCEKKEVIQDEMKRLFDIANVNEEEQYFIADKQIKEKQQYHNEINKIEQQLSIMFSKELRSILLSKSIHQHELKKKINLLKKQKEKLEEKHIALNKQLVTLEMEIDQLELSDDHSKTAFIYQVERDKLNGLAKKWAVFKTALTILEKAKQTYQEKYLQEVIDVTSQNFNKLTNGKYTQVFPPTDMEPFHVEASNHIRYTVDELSKGTVDQLYVSLRLAISRVMSNKHIIPLIIDDAFIHFDESRTEQAIQLLKEISREQQIFLFTCRKHTANMLNTEQEVNKVSI